MVIADTSVWITFQRDPRSAVGQEFDSLLAEDEVVMVGPVLAELLQGARSESEFEFFRLHLTALSFLETDQDTWTRAGELNYRLREHGSMLAFADLIIASLAMQHGIAVYTVDGDFGRVPGLALHEARSWYKDYPTQDSR